MENLFLSGDYVIILNTITIIFIFCTFSLMSSQEMN